MTTNNSGKLNMGGVSAIKDIVTIPAADRTERQTERLNACLTALAHQPRRWESYQDWGKGGPTAFLAEYGIEFIPVSKPQAKRRSWYDGCDCRAPHWRERNG